MALQEPGSDTDLSCQNSDIVYGSLPLLHMDTHLQQEEERKYKCDECGRGYRHAGSLANHKKTHDVGLFECDICGKENSNALSLKNHLRSHTLQKKYKCLQCGKAFYRASQLVAHEKVHKAEGTKDDCFSKVDMEFVTCEDQKKFQNGDTDCFLSAAISTQNSTSDSKTDIVYNTQAETNDLDNRPFKCDLCDKAYIHQRSLCNHKKTHQTGMFECTVCLKLFNNMAALNNHQRSHKSKSQVDSLCGTYAATSPDQFSPQSQDVPVNFCQLCQVLFLTEEEFQDHIQIHNSSPSCEVQDDFSYSNSALYDNGTASHKSPFYASPVNIESFDLPNKQIINNSQTNNYSSHETAFSTSPQEELCVKDTHVLAQNTNSNMDETPAVEKKLFKCNICFKTYRHSGSLINHKRSHQVGNYQCLICGKSCPHLAALKGHLRIHKGLPKSRRDWLSRTMEDQLHSYPHENANSDAGAELNSIDDNTSEDLYNKDFNQEYSADAQLPYNDHPMQRHMCADCGQTFADFAGIKSHNCLSLQQQHNTTTSTGIDENLQESSIDEDPSRNLEFIRPNGQKDRCFDPENESNDHLDTSGVFEQEKGEDFIQCSICGNSYSNIRALRSHLQGHTHPYSASCSSVSSPENDKEEESAEMMICSTCGESFSNTQDLVNHQLLHNEDQLDRNIDNDKCEVKDENLICGCCGIFCSSLENHECTFDTNQPGTEIEDEMEGQNSNTDLSFVKEVVNSVDRQYRCEQCGRSYRHSASLLNHKKSHKTGLFGCSVCQKRFYNLLALKNHQRSHFDVKRYTCQECERAFKTRKQLLRHLRRHKENQAKIQDLNNQIQALMQMNETRSDPAIQSVGANASQDLPQTLDKIQCKKSKATIKSEDTGDKRPYACDQCGRTYRHAGSLANHRKSHKTGEYHCSICNKTYSNQLTMKNHLRSHLAFKRHSCQNCGKRFRAESQLSVHVCASLRKKSSESSRSLRSRFKCKECKLTFSTSEQVTAHKCNAHPKSSDQTNVSLTKEERPFKCNICSRSYRHAASLLNHKNTHKTGHYNCTFCSKPFTNPMALRNHTRIHTQKRRYVCLTCGKAFRLASILHSHQKVHNRIHNSEFSCGACGKSFQGRSGLQRHRCHKHQRTGSAAKDQQQDKGNKCFMCDLCGRSYRHAGSLLNHKKTHSESLDQCALCLQTFPDPLSLHAHSRMKRHCCPECGKIFCLLSHLEVHSKDHHQNEHHMVQGPHQDNGFSWDSNRNVTAEPPPLSHLPEKAYTDDKGHICEHCGRTYRHASSLLNHKNSHKTGLFSCAVCQREFTNLMALRNHRRIHTEPKRYQCSECGKAFRVSSQLMCHRRIHTKEKPFECTVCNKSFSSKSNLRHHVRIHQSNTPNNGPSYSMEDNHYMDVDMSAFDTYR